MTPNGNVIATDGHQDYNDASEAQEMGEAIVKGEYRNYRVVKENVL